MNMTIDLLGGLQDGLRPLERLKPSAWADAHRYLSSTSSAEPGRWRTSRTPYLREIMDCFDPYSPVQEVVIMKGAQLGLTEGGFNVMGFVIDVDPGPIMYVMPTIETVKRNSKMRIQPMFEDTPNLKKKVMMKKSRSSGTSIFQKDFPGGTLILGGANSAASLRSVPIRTLILDEVDAFPLDLDGEGSPVDLAKARTRTFSRKKILYISTPTVQETSVIESLFESTDQRYFHVPCPECGVFQILTWQNLKWEKGKPETARYCCEGCDAELQDKDKTMMLKQGRWISSAPEKSNPKKVGFHLSSLYSPFGWYSWQEAAEEWEEAMKDTTQMKLKVFVNTVLGETWRESGDVPEWEALHDRRSKYGLNQPPEDVCLITAGVDVQKDRLEVEIVGWCPGLVSYSLDYRILTGDTSERPVWDELAKIVSEQWHRSDGVTLPMAKMAIDTGYNTSFAYDFCRRFLPSQVIPVKGRDSLTVIIGTPSAVDRNSKGKKAGALTLFPVGVSILKQEIYGHLKQHLQEDGTAPDGFCYFPEAYGPEYFKQLTAEQLQKKFVRGYTIFEWVKIRTRNEALDCRVYARAAASQLGVDRWDFNDWDALVKNYRMAGGTTKRRDRSERSRSSFWDR
jgi:phage terminase large subunit GpA-like protein